MPGPWHNAWTNEVTDADRRDVYIAPKFADAVTLSGLVVEFQHSHISIFEVAKRERHYGTGIWVVDMTFRTTVPSWVRAARWRVFLDYGDYIKPMDSHFKLRRTWLVDFLNSGQNLIGELDWRHAKPAGNGSYPYSYCVLCDKVAYMLDPFDGLPKHKTCAQDALSYNFAGGAL